MIKSCPRNLLFMATLVLLFSCGSSNKSDGNNLSTNQFQNADNTKKIIANDIEFAARFNRKVTLTNMKNFQDFKINANLHKIIINSLKDQKIENGTFQCFDISSKTAAPKLINRTNLVDGRYAEIEIDTNNSDDFEYKISCSAYKDNLVIGNAIEHTFYRDLIVDSDINFNSRGLGLNIGENKIGALIITSHGNLVTMGNDIKIIATDVLFENGGSIETFRKNDIETADNQNGLPGGKIEIITDNAFGPLKVNLRGRNGGRQTKPRPKELPTESHSSKIFLQGTSSCPSTKGPTGIKGLVGLNGFNGGDSGSLFIMINNNQHHFDEITENSINYYPGFGSKGGLGGEGGRGGIGNSYVLTYDAGYDCSAPRCHPPMGHKTCDASYGDTGETGSIGPDGKDGNKQTFQINN